MGRKSKVDHEPLCEIYKLIEERERSLAEICFILGTDFKIGKVMIPQQMTTLCEYGFLITELETTNNTYYGLLESPINQGIHNEIFGGTTNDNCSRQLEQNNAGKILSG